jgi:hypothetical protein
VVLVGPEVTETVFLFVSRWLCVSHMHLTAAVALGVHCTCASLCYGHPFGVFRTPYLGVLRWSGATQNPKSGVSGSREVHFGVSGVLGPQMPPGGAP